MKLLRHGPPGFEKPGILDGGGRIRDLSGAVADIDAAAVAPDGLARLGALDPESLPLVGGGPRIGPCLAGAGRFFCIGLNYSDHAAEAGLTVPDNPILFMKVCPPTGPNDDVRVPRDSEKMDYEVELGVVIGTRAHHVSEADALAHVAGYCVVNDLSERDFQMKFSGQWVKGKSCDGFGPIGPWLVTADEVADPQDLALFLDVNGEARQRGNTRTMVFPVAAIVAHLSRFVTLEPGDLIATGTPPGVGMGMTPPVYLRAGDEIALGIAGLGEQRQRVVAYAAPD